MDLNTQKEEFSYAYVYAVASSAGYSFQRASRPLDFDGIDVIIAGSGGGSLIRYPRLELQVKCTSMDVLGDELIRLPLELKNYNELRVENIQVPRILVVVLVPDTSENWLRSSEAELCMRHCGYWISLRGQPATPNQTSVTVYIPRQNIFNVDALKSLMQRIEIGENL